MTLNYYDKLYDTGNILSRCTQSIVKNTICKKTKKEFIVKISQMQYLTPKQKRALNREIKICSTLKHCNILQLHETFLEEKEKLYLIYEKITGNDLFFEIEHKCSENYVFSESVICHYMKQLFDAIEYIHDRNIIHGDIRPHAIALASKNDDSILKITSFSCAMYENKEYECIKEISQLVTQEWVYVEESRNGLIGMADYSPVIENEKISKSLDMWLSGVFLYLMLCGKLPFLVKNSFTQYLNLFLVESDNVDIKMDGKEWQPISKPAKDLCRRLMHPISNNSFSIEQAINHPWLNNKNLNCNLKESVYNIREFNKIRRLKESIFGMAFRKEINNIECPCIYKILNNNQLSGVVWKIINSINTKSIQSHVLDQNIVNNDDSKHELTGLLYRTNLISLLKIYDIINFQIIPKIKQCPVKQEIIMSNNIEYNQNKIFVKQINQKLIEFNHIFPILRICYVILTEKHFKLNENVNNIATNLLSNDSTLLQEIKKIKIVQFEKKIGEQIGITLKHDRNHNCLISRILCGGKVYNQDILKAHDQILEINNVSVKNKNLEMIQNMLVNTNGSITIKILPYLRQSESKLNIYVKALYNYDPYDDEDHPCPEAGIYFLMGHILHIVNQDDQDWWQACIVNNQSVCSCQQDESTKFNFKVGVIPSELFLKSKISTKSEKKPKSHGFFKFKQKKSNIPILKPVNIKDRYRVQRDDPNINFYKEVVWCKSFSRKTIILIGPHGVGRRHIKNTLIAMKPWKYSYPIPHTTRDPRLDEMNGTNYYFISQSQMINDIKNNEYLEFGTLTECIYGTKLETIRQLCDKKIIPIIDVEPNAIKLLYNSDFCPLIVFIAAPTHSVFNEDDSLKNLLKESYEIEMNYGHYFDVKIENSDIDETIETIQTSINNFFNKPQWIPIEWVT